MKVQIFLTNLKINKMNTQENKQVSELTFELPLNYTNTRLSPLSEFPVKLYSFLMENLKQKIYFDQMSIPLDNSFNWKIIKQEGKFVTLSYIPKSNSCNAMKDSDNDNRVIEEETNKNPFSFAGVLVHDFSTEQSSWYPKSERKVITNMEESKDSFIANQLLNNKNLIIKEGYPDGYCNNPSCFCDGSCKVDKPGIGNQSFKLKLEKDWCDNLQLNKKEVVKDMQEVTQDLITGDSGEHTKEDLNNLSTVLEKHKDLSDDEYMEEIEKLINEEIAENKKINNEIYIDYHDLLESKFICNTKKECKTLKKLLLRLNLLSVCYECDVCYIVKAVHCGVVNYNPLIKNNDSYEKTLNIYSSIQEIEFEEAKRNIEYFISERNKTFNKFQVSNSKYLKPSNCKLIPVSSPYEKKFTEEDVTDLQNKVYKITGKGEVMQLFNELLGINAG